MLAIGQLDRHRGGGGADRAIRGIRVAWASVLLHYCSLPFTLWALKRALGITPLDALSAIAKPLTASLIMGAAVWGLMEAHPPGIRPGR